MLAERPILEVLFFNLFAARRAGSSSVTRDQTRAACGGSLVS